MRSASADKDEASADRGKGTILITISNTYGTAKVFANEIDSGAEGLLRALCGSSLSEGSRIRVMPDVHAGKGCAVGTTMTYAVKLAPGLVGVDIGCGVLAVKTDARRVELQRFDRVVRERVPAGMRLRNAPHKLSAQAGLERLRCAKSIYTERDLLALGTLGGGNHFIELDRGEDGFLWLLVHSGSRALGAEVEAHYHRLAYEATPPDVPYELAWLSGAALDDYLHDMEVAQNFAALNRAVIAAEILRGAKMDETDRIDTVHNYVDTEKGIMRKGAVSAQEGERLIIPMNMRDGALLCVGRGNADWNCSAPHGAGRAKSRNETRNSVTLSAYKKAMKGIYSTSIGRDTLDEAPMAYKPAAQIAEQIAPTAGIIERLTPVYNFKAGGD